LCHVVERELLSITNSSFFNFVNFSNLFTLLILLSIGSL